MSCSEVGDKVIETKVIERNEDDSDFTYADAENDMEAEYQSFECVYPVAYWRYKNNFFSLGCRVIQSTSKLVSPYEQKKLLRSSFRTSSLCQGDWVSMS